MIEALMLEAIRETVGEDQQRRSIQIGARDPVHDRRHARPESRQARAWLSGDFGLRHRRQRCSRFCRREHERQARAASRVDEIQVAAATGYAKQRANARSTQGLDHQIGNRRHRGDHVTPV